MQCLMKESNDLLIIFNTRTFLFLLLIFTGYVWLSRYNNCLRKCVNKSWVSLYFLIVYKAMNGQAPSYISELISLTSNAHSHNLRSSNDKWLLKMPTSKTKVTLGDRAFSCAAPKIWNNLPLLIRKSQSIISFKTELKTHLFVQAFPHT